MTTEFNLSDKAIKDYSNNPIPSYYWENDVKEFIRLLKNEIDGQYELSDGDLFFPTDIKDMIDKLAGDKLI